jgi:PilZ domain-containing protein
VIEQRANQRYGLHLAISLRRERLRDASRQEERPLIGETVNISTTGMYFTTVHRLTLNEIVNFSVTFPGMAQGIDVCVVGRARVVRIVRNADTVSERFGIGVVTEECHRRGCVNYRSLRA